MLRMYQIQMEVLLPPTLGTTKTKFIRTVSVLISTTATRGPGNFEMGVGFLDWRIYGRVPH